MLKRRIIPFLLIDENLDCIKTTQFKKRNYIGDIFNNIRIFNEKKAEEIVVLDIDASKNNTKPNFDLIDKIASVCRMPLTYGGGINTLETAKEIIALGVEKICINTAALNDIGLIKRISDDIGSQSLSVSLNIKKINNEFKIVNNFGKVINIDIINFLKKIQTNGVGEIIFNSLDDDGCMKGYNFEILENFLKYIGVPSIILGGCSQIENIRSLFKTFESVAAGCSSIFLYKGKFKAVLISYPSELEKLKIYKT
jgi:cyclase